MSTDATKDPAEIIRIATATLEHANKLRDERKTDLSEILLAYDQAANQLTEPAPPTTAEGVNLLANIWTNRGMTLLETGDGSLLPEALKNLDEALVLRRALPLEQDVNYRWGLCGTLMNKADVATRMGGEENLRIALAAYDEALKHFQAPAMQEHPRYPARVALAHMNRGITYAVFPEGVHFPEAAESFDAAVTAFDGVSEPLNPEQLRILGCSLMNRGNMHLNRTNPQPSIAREDAKRAMALSAEFERREPLAAEMSLQSKHLLCRATAIQVELGGANPQQAGLSEDWVTETTDAVDDGMELARYWRKQGEERLQYWEGEIFRFGVQIYRLCLPHFLAEFVLDSMDDQISPGAPSARMDLHQVATEIIWSTVEAIGRTAEQTQDVARKEKLIGMLHTFQQAEFRLAEIRNAHAISLTATV